MKSTNEIKRRIISVRDVAVILGVTTRTVHRMVINKSIPYLRIPTGGAANTMKICFDMNAIDEWLDSLQASSDYQPDTPRKTLKELAFALVSED